MKTQSCNISFGWNVKTHQYITRKALEDNKLLTESEIKRIMEYSMHPDFMPDELEDFNSRHFYDALHEDPSFGTVNDERNNALSAFLEHNKNAETAIKEGKTELYFKELAYAAHYLQDGSTPLHTAHGNYFTMLCRLPMHINFERGKKLGASSKLDILEKNYKYEKIPFSNLWLLFHNTALFTVQSENKVNCFNKSKWLEIQQRCVNRGINSTKAYFDYILKFLSKH